MPDRAVVWSTGGADIFKTAFRSTIIQSTLVTLQIGTTRLTLKSVKNATGNSGKDARHRAPFNTTFQLAPVWHAGLRDGWVTGAP